jgi:hypothetical protein
MADLAAFLTAFLTARLDEDEAAALGAKADPDGRTYEGDPDDGRWTAYQHPAGQYDSDQRPFWLIGTEVMGTERGWTIGETGRHPRSEAYGRHIARHDPARVLAEIAAKRGLIAKHVPEGVAYCPNPTCAVHHPSGQPLLCIVQSAAYLIDAYWPCLELRLLAAPYADHPDYQREWSTE